MLEPDVSEQAPPAPSQPEPPTAAPFGETWSAAVVLSLFLPVLIVAAPLVFARQRIRPPGKVEPLAELPDAVSSRNAAAFAAYRADLEREGFRSGGLALLSDLNLASSGGPSERMVVECFEHRTQKHAASLILFVPRQPNYNPPPVIRFVEQLGDGTRVVTWNAPYPPVYPNALTTHALRLPKVKDVAELYAVQRGMLQRFTPGYSPPGLPEGGTEAVILEENRWSTDGWIARKWVVPTERPGEYRNAWWLAIRMGWGVMPPIGYLRAWCMRRRNDRLRAAWGL